MAVSHTKADTRHRWIRTSEVGAHAERYHCPNLQQLSDFGGNYLVIGRVTVFYGAWAIREQGTEGLARKVKLDRVWRSESLHCALSLFCVT